MTQTVTVSTTFPEGDGYAYAPSVEEALAAQDVNFDGLDDLVLADRLDDGTLTHHYWLWDGTQFRLAFTLQDAELHPEDQTITVSRRYLDNVDFTDTYQYDDAGELVLVRRRAEDWKQGTEDFPLVAYYEFPGGVPTLMRQEFTDYDNLGRITREVREMVDGQLTPVRLEILQAADGGFQVVETQDLVVPVQEVESGDDMSDTVPGEP